MKNYGLNLALEKKQQSPEDWKFGATSAPCLAIIPENERERYLPVGEVQRGVEDMMDCASRGPLNVLETKFTYLLQNKKLKPANEAWLRDNGYVVDGRVVFSDAFIAINSNTTREGNSLKAPLEAIRKFGLIPKPMLPLLPDMTWEQYHNPSRIDGRMYTLGQEFARRFTINYERILEEDYPILLRYDIAVVAGFAWPAPELGEYMRVDFPPNHCFILFRNPQYYAFDNYIDDVDGDFTKKLSRDYDFWEYGYRVLITSENDAEMKVSWWQRLLSWLF